MRYRRRLISRPGKYMRRRYQSYGLRLLNRRIHTDYFGFKRFAQLARVFRNRAKPKDGEAGFTKRLNGLDNRLGLIAYQLDLAPTVR